jgi:hypothetical protein
MTVLCWITTFWAGFASLSAFSWIAALLVLPQLSTIFPTNATPRGPIGAPMLISGLLVVPFVKMFQPRKRPVISGLEPVAARNVNSGKFEHPAA